MALYKNAVEKTIENLSRRQFAAYYCETSEEARDLALSLIPEGDKVAWGGSKTAEQIGLIEAVRTAGKFSVVDRDKAACPEEKAALMREGLTSDTFISGINALSTDGWIVNIDRARNVAAPLNAQRFDIATPCKTTGKCADCLSPSTICSQFVLTRFCKPAGRIKVIIVGESLGM